MSFHTLRRLKLIPLMSLLILVLVVLPSDDYVEDFFKVSAEANTPNKLQNIRIEYFIVVVL